MSTASETRTSQPPQRLKTAHQGVHRRRKPALPGRRRRRAGRRRKDGEARRLWRPGSRNRRRLQLWVRWLSSPTTSEEGGGGQAVGDHLHYRPGQPGDVEGGDTEKRRCPCGIMTGDRLRSPLPGQDAAVEQADEGQAAVSVLGGEERRGQGSAARMRP